MVITKIDVFRHFLLLAGSAIVASSCSVNHESPRKGYFVEPKGEAPSAQELRQSFSLNEEELYKELFCQIANAMTVEEFERAKRNIIASELSLQLKDGLRSIAEMYEEACFSTSLSLRSSSDKTYVDYLSASDKLKRQGELLVAAGKALWRTLRDVDPEKAVQEATKDLQAINDKYKDKARENGYVGD